MDDKDVFGEILDEQTQHTLRKYFAKNDVHKLSRSIDLRESTEMKPEFMRIKIDIEGDAQLDTNGLGVDLEARGGGRVSWKTLRNILTLPGLLKRLKPSS